MSSSKVNTWSTKHQSLNGLKVTLVKKRKSSPEQQDVDDGSTEEIQQSQTGIVGGPRWTIESNKNPCKLVIKRRKTNDFRDSSKETCSASEPSLKMRIVASTKTSQDCDTTFSRVNNWCKQQISNSASVAGYDNYLASDLHCSQSSPKCSGLEGCLPAELFHLQPSPKDSGIDVSSPPRRLDEIHLADGSSCVAMATISENATAVLSSATSVVVSDVVMAMFSNAECSDQDSMLHAAKQGVDKSVLKTGKARLSGEVMTQVSGRRTRRLSSLQSLCNYGLTKPLSAMEEDQMTLRLPSLMFHASVAGDVRTRNASPSGVTAEVNSGKQIRPVTYANANSSDPSGLDITDKIGSSNGTGHCLTPIPKSKDPAVPKGIGATSSKSPTGPTYARKVKSKTKAGLVLTDDVKAKDQDITEQTEGLYKTDPVVNEVMVAKGSKFTKELQSKFQINESFTRENGNKAKICQNITTENRSKRQTDDSIREINGGKGQVDPSITEENRGKDLIDLSISGEKRSKDRVGPSFTRKNNNKAKIFATEKRCKDQTVASITEETRGKEETDPSITQKQRSKDHVGPSITGKKRGKDHVGPSITDPGASATKMRTEDSRRKNRTSSAVSGEVKSKTKPCPVVSKEMNSHASADPSIGDETHSKKWLNPSIVTEVQYRENPACPTVTEETRNKKQSAPKAGRGIRNKNNNGPVVTEERRNTKKADDSAVKRDLKSRNQICPIVTSEMNVKDLVVPFDDGPTKSLTINTPQMGSDSQTSSGLLATTNKGQFELGCALELNTVNQTTAGTYSKVSAEEIQGRDVVSKSLKRNSKACELIPESQPKRNGSAQQARKWHAGSRNSASRRSFDRLCHATEIPPPLLTLACSDPLRTTEYSVDESSQNSAFFSGPPLLSERPQSGLAAAHSEVEHSKTVTKPSAAGDRMTERDQLYSLYEFEDDSPPILEFNKTVNGRSIFPRRSRLPKKETCVDILTSTSRSLNSSSDRGDLKSVSLAPDLGPSSLQKTVDLPSLEANASRSETDVWLKTSTRSICNYMGEFAKFVSGRQLSKNEAEEPSVKLSTSDIVHETQIDKLERLNVKVKENQSLSESSSEVTVTNKNSSIYSSASQNTVKPGGRNAMSKRKSLCKPTSSELQTKSDLRLSANVRGVCPEISKDNESSLCLSKENCMESEHPNCDDATGFDCNTLAGKLQTITYHKSVSEDMSETSENSIEPEQFDFSLFISGQKSLARLRDKVAILLRTVFPGVVHFCDNPNVSVFYKFLDQLVDEVTCNKAGSESVNRIETCCCDCEVSLCRTPKRCLGVFQRKVLDLLQILLPAADLGNIEAGEIEPLVDAVTLANATQLGQEHCPGDEFSKSELSDGHACETVNTDVEERCCNNSCFHSGRNCHRDLCCHGDEHSHDSVNFGSDIRHSAIHAPTCSEDLPLKSEDSCVNR